MANSVDTTNPLNDFRNTEVKYVLCAFEYTEDACMHDVGSGIGKSGDEFSGSACGGKAIVIVNEFVAGNFIINDFEADFNYHSYITPSSTQMVAQMTVLDRFGGQFPTFMRDAAQKLGVSQTHMAFVLKIFFIGVKPDKTTDTVVTKKFIFNMGAMTQVYTTDETPHSYRILALATYNTFGMLPTFSKLYQTTVTHYEQNPSKEVPKPEGVSSGLMPRRAEDALKETPRKTRMDKSKTMPTLGVLFDSFREDLMQQKYEHKRQLQEWLSHVRDDHTKKIEQPIQIRGYLPIDYIMGMDGEYKDYKIDNRNMIFEQPEQGQDKFGIKTFPISEGDHILLAMDKMMKLSRKTGRDALETPRKTFKTNINVMRRCQGKYDVFLKVKKHKLPTNTPNGVDTGPGENPINPLYFEFQKSDLEDTNIRSVDMVSASFTDLNTLERQVDTPDARVVIGNREQTTAERSADVGFFQSMFSGVRSTTNGDNTNLESAEDAAQVDKMLTANMSIQNNTMNVKIRGNPSLLSDIFRNPFWVKNDEADDPVYYQKPEVEAMYARVMLHITPPANSLTVNADSGTAPIYYYTKYYHISRIYTKISGNHFEQQLTLLRTDDVV